MAKRITRYQDLMVKHYNVKVKPCHFKVGDLVLRKVTTTTRDPAQGKLGPNWEPQSRGQLIEVPLTKVIDL